MVEEIVVEIMLEEVEDFSPYCMTQTMILGRLKKAGIPVRGILFFDGVESGTLEQEEDFQRNSYIFRWKP
jgi:hypothetical protein